MTDYPLPKTSTPELGFVAERIRQRRATDPEPERNDLGVNEFQIPRGSLSFAHSVTGHEHMSRSGLDLERSTVTCPESYFAVRFGAVDMTTVTAEVPADVWLLARQSAQAAGTSSADFARSVVLAGLEALGISTKAKVTGRK